MRLRIHRGTKEIGGTCIEVEAQGKRLALDVGLPLDAPDDEGAQNACSRRSRVSGSRTKACSGADLASAHGPLRSGAAYPPGRSRSGSVGTRTTS